MTGKTTGGRSRLLDNVGIASDWCTVVATSLVISALAVGCSSSDEWTRKRPKTVRTTGEVFYRGKPLADAMVTFTNSVAERSGSGMTDAKGHFSLTTFETGDGVVPGPQGVAIRKVEIDFPGTKLQGLSPQEMQATIKTMSEAELASLPFAQERWLIPERFGAPKTSKLTAEVADNGENSFKFELDD